MRKLFVLGLVMMFALPLLAACGGDDDSSSSSGTPKLSGKVTDKGSKTVSGDEIELEADDFYFEPTVIKADGGAEIEVEIENEGDATHNFSVDDQGIDTDVEAGSSAEVTVTVPDSGELVFYCKFHKSQGMAGEFEAA